MSDHDNDACPHLVRASLLEAENARLKAEVERLRKAGDAMAVCLEAYNRCKPYDGPMTLDCLKSWRAAKEGKPSV